MKTTTNHTIALLFGIFLGLILLFPIYLVVFQNTIVFQPSKKLENYDKPLDTIEDVLIPTNNGVRLHAWHLDRGSEQTVIFFHGNGGNVGAWKSYMSLFDRLGFNALLIDYRGYGKSEGSLPRTERVLYADAVAVFDYATNILDVPEADVILWGRSLGCTNALYLARNRKLTAVILEAPFYSGKRVAREILGFRPPWPLLLFPMRNDLFIQDLSSPVLIVSSEDDELFPASTHGIPLYDRADSPKQMIETEGGHNDPPFLRQEEKYRTMLREFLAKN